MTTFQNVLNKQWQWIKEALVLALVSIVSLFVARWLKLPQPYWTVMSSIIVVQSDVQLTLKTSWSRLAGTAIGAVIGAVCVHFLGNGALAFGVAVINVVLICVFLGLKDSYRFAAVTVVIVMLINSPESAWKTGFFRFLEVSVGILIAVGVLLFINLVVRWMDRRNS